MKHFAIIIAALVLMLFSCSKEEDNNDVSVVNNLNNVTENTAKDDEKSDVRNLTIEPDESTIPDLSGEWKQVNSNSGENYQIANITDETIEIYWIMDDTKALYWAGSFTAPTESGAYSWESINDKEKTDYAILASGADTKTFDYSDGIISYEASAMGVTTIINLEKVD